MAAVAIGLGLVTPLGTSLGATVAALASGAVAGKQEHVTRRGRPILTARIDPLSVPVTLRARKLEKFLSWTARLALHAVAEACRAGSRVLDQTPPEFLGVYVAAGQTGLECDEFFSACSAAWPDAAPGDYGQLGGPPLRLIDPHFSLRTLANAPASFIAMEHDARGPSIVFVQAANAGVVAVQAAIDDLSLGRCRTAIVAACDSLTGATTVLLRERSGLLDGADAATLSEGAAALVLAREDDAAVQTGERCVLPVDSDGSPRSVLHHHALGDLGAATFLAGLVVALHGASGRRPVPASP